MNIILDTNILRKDLKFRSSEFKVVEDYLEKTQSKIYLPKIVYEEILELYKKHIIDNFNNYERSLSKFNKAIMKSKISNDYDFDVNKELNEFKNLLELVLVLDDDSKIDYKDHYLKELIDRAVRKKKPLGEKGQQFRDGVLWLTILDFAESTEERRVIFISENLSDFGEKGTNKLCDELRREANNRKVEIIYFRTISDFIKEHASKMDFIDQKWIDNRLDIEIINHLFNRAIEKENDKILETAKDYIEGNEVSVGKVEATKEIDSDIIDFFVYELTNGDRLLNAQMSINKEYRILVERVVEKYHYTSGITARYNPRTGDVEFEPEFNPKLDFDFEIESKYINISFVTRFVLTIKDDEIINYELSSWELDN